MQRASLQGCCLGDVSGGPQRPSPPTFGLVFNGNPLGADVTRGVTRWALTFLGKACDGGRQTTRKVPTLSEANSQLVAPASSSPGPGLGSPNQGSAGESSELRRLRRPSLNPCPGNHKRDHQVPTSPGCRGPKVSLSCSRPSQPPPGPEATQPLLFRRLFLLWTMETNHITYRMGFPELLHKAPRWGAGDAERTVSPALEARSGAGGPLIQAADC